MVPPNQAQKNIGTLVIEATQMAIEFLFLIFQVFYAFVLRIFCLIVRQQPKSVRGEIVLVTGGGHGIGKELALLYAFEGATVVVWDINEENGNQTVKEIAQLGYPVAYFFKCNVGNRDDVLNVAKEVQDKVGDVTILINNAGIMPVHSFLEHSKEEIERVMNVNVMAHYWTIQAFLPTMKAHNHGHIVCISSCLGLNGIPNFVPYCCSKYAVRGLMDALYEEFRADKKNKIEFTTIYPYIVDTGLVKNPKIKFDNLMPIIKPKEAAAVIMNVQRRGVKEATIPRSALYGKLLLGLLPLKAQEYINDFISVEAEVDSD